MKDVGREDEGCADAGGGDKKKIEFGVNPFMKVKELPKWKQDCLESRNEDSPDFRDRVFQGHPNGSLSDKSLEKFQHCF